MADIREASMANTMVKPSWPNICPARSSTVARGRYTTIVVIVEAMIDMVTALVPRSAASL